MLKFLIRYGLAGLLNTAIGYATIIAMDVGFGLKSHLANLVGYIVGAGVGYFLQRTFVFGSDAPHRQSVGKYAAAVVGAFLINQFVLSIGLSALGREDLARAIAQLIAVMAYSIVLFILLKLWVFPDKRSS